MIQLSMQQRLLQLLKTLKHLIYGLMIVVLYCFYNLALKVVISTLIDAGNWLQRYYCPELLMKRLSSVTSQLAAAAILWRHHLCVRRLECVLLSVITPWWCLYLALFAYLFVLLLNLFLLCYMYVDYIISLCFRIDLLIKFYNESIMKCIERQVPWLEVVGEKY